ncbi:MATE family efflux transporter [Reinekea sp.]|jgi:putative MATE family efflux protein|uniref:MATE family efflux transporter n=1 Tax=Reinekea sp. TaxID=1970455 RepID=UPI003989261F
MPQSLLSQVLKLALPVAMQSVLISLLGMSDVFMVAGLGAGAVAAIGIGAKLHFVLVMVMASLGSAVSVLVAQYYGRGSTQSSQGILALGMVSGLVLMLPVALLFTVMPEQLLSLLSDDENLIALGTSYLRITVPLLFLTHILICYESALRARSETMLPLILAAIAIVINIALNYVLIHGIWFFPELGSSGVAIASDIARLIQVLLFFWILARRHHLLSLGRLLKAKQEVLKHAKQFYTIAWPLTLNFTLWGFGSFVYHGIASAKGTDALASLSLISPIEGLYHSLFFGLVTACSVLIGQNLGQDKFDTAKYLARKFSFFAPLGSLIVGLVLLASSPIFLPWLISPSEPLYQLSMQLMWVMCLSFWLKVLNMTIIVGILRAGGDSKYIVGVDMVAMWALGIPAAMLAAFYFELSYVWVYAMVLVEEAAKAVMVIKRAIKGIWLKNLGDYSAA